MMSNVSSSKKRKANDGRATVPDGAHDVISNTNDGGGFFSSWFGYFSGQRVDAASSGPSHEVNNTSQLDRMEVMMMRMEEKLATVSCLESRCEQLEAKCSSLETMLESTSQSTKEHIDRKLESTSQSTKDHIDKTLKYHEMLIRNQNWDYSAPVCKVDELLDVNYDDNEAYYIYENSQVLKRSTEALRGGDFPDQSVGTRVKGISLCIDDGYPLVDDETNNELSPHWREFAAALKDFKPAFDVLPDDSETSITFGNIQLNQEMTQLIKEVLMKMPFKLFSLQYSYHFHGGMSTIAEMMDNNKYLQILEVHRILDMDSNDITKLCSAIHHHPSLVDVSITGCFSTRLGNEMLQTLLRTDGLKLERLGMAENSLNICRTGINVCTLLSNYLATNPRLKFLDLTDNYFDDRDAVLIANALRSNTTLRHLIISENVRMGEPGDALFCIAVCNESSLNSVADSNHSCMIETEYALDGNENEERGINRAKKIYRLLSSRHKTMSNVQQFGDIDVKLLPNVLEAVQKYSNRFIDGDDDIGKAFSIVYEIMRCWDKVPSLYLR